MEVGHGRERARGQDRGLHGDTTDAAAQGPTAPVLALDLTAAVHRHDDTRPPRYCPTSSPNPVTTTATRRAAADTTTAAPVTKGNALAPALALPSKWTGSESGTETESALTFPKNTSTSAAAATETAGTARGLARTSGTGSAATRANTTAAAAATQDTAATAADPDPTPHGLCTGALRLVGRPLRFQRSF